MHRPTRLHQHLVSKVAEKQARNTKKKPGRKTKAWSKWVALYAPLAQGAEASSES
jgi:hypothetical protein